MEAGEGEDGGRSARQPSRAVPWVWILGEGGEGVGKGAPRLRGWRETATATSTLVFQLVRALSAS